MGDLAAIAALESLVNSFRPKISVITVCLNARRHITPCLASVAAQKGVPVQHVVIDGRSNDGTLDIIQTFPHVSVLISEPDTGIFSAMNKGLNYVDGDYVIFLNADDSFHDDLVLSDVVAFLERHPVDLAYGRIAVRMPGAKPFIYDPPGGLDVFGSLVVDPLPHQATFARRRLFKQIGGFSERFRILSDYEWILRAFATPGVIFARMARTIANYSMAGASADPGRRLPELFAIQRESALLGPASDANLKLLEFQERLTSLECQLFDLRRNARLPAEDRTQGAEVPDASVWQSRTCLGGIYADGWAGLHMLLHYGTGASNRLVSIDLELPATAPQTQVEVYFSDGNDKPLAGHTLPRGGTATLDIPIGASAGILEGAFMPWVRGAEDPRALTLLVRNVEIHADGGSIRLFPRRI